MCASERNEGPYTVQDVAIDGRNVEMGWNVGLNPAASTRLMKQKNNEQPVLLSRGIVDAAPPG